MSEEFDAIDELGKAAHMPPKSTRDVLIVDPECIERLRTMLAELRETTLDGLPHSEPGECPTWYDKCNCTVENLQHNIKRADEAEAENARLREALQDIWLVADTTPIVHMVGPEAGAMRKMGHIARKALEPQP